MAKLLGLSSSTALAGQMGKHKHFLQNRAEEQINMSKIEFCAQHRQQ